MHQYIDTISYGLLAFAVSSSIGLTNSGYMIRTSTVAAILSGIIEQFPVTPMTGR